jgi:hypothetical protein
MGFQGSKLSGSSIPDPAAGVETAERRRASSIELASVRQSLNAGISMSRLSMCVRPFRDLATRYSWKSGDFLSSRSSCSDFARARSKGVSARPVIIAFAVRIDERSRPRRCGSALGLACDFRSNASTLRLFQIDMEFIDGTSAIILRSFAARGGGSLEPVYECRVCSCIFQIPHQTRVCRCCLGAALRSLSRGNPRPCPSLLAHVFLFRGLHDGVSTATGRRNQNENTSPRCRRQLRMIKNG